VLVGAFIALVVPISYLVVALLVENGIAPYDQTHDLFLGPLSVLGWVSLFLLGPIGIVLSSEDQRRTGPRGRWRAL
jgi:hypothetical protein